MRSLNILQAGCRKLCTHLEKHPGHTALAVIILDALFLWNWVYPKIRFSSHVADELVGLLFFFTPFILLINLFFFRSTIFKVVQFILLLPVLLVCMFGLIYQGAVVGHDIESDEDPLFKRLQTVHLDYSRVVAYRTNGGATTDFGIVVRHEMRLFPGAKLVRQIYSEYHKSEVRMGMVAADTVKVEDDRYALKPFVYF